MKKSFIIRFVSFLFLASLASCYSIIWGTPDSSIITLVQPCLVVKERTSSYYSSYAYMPVSEILELNGEKYKLGPVGEYTYIYDSLGRIKQEYCNSGMLCTSYVYNKSTVYRAAYNYMNSVNNMYYTVRDTIRLNQQGYDNYYAYDTDGHVVGLSKSPSPYTSKWLNGNLTETIQTWNDPYVFIRSTYAYDDNILNTPVIRQFEGRKSKNALLADSTIAEKMPLYTYNWFGDGKAIYRYVLNSEGRIGRQIKIMYGYDKEAKKYNDKLNIIEVKDFEYACR